MLRCGGAPEHLRIEARVSAVAASRSNAAWRTLKGSHDVTDDMHEPCLMISFVSDRCFAPQRSSYPLLSSSVPSTFREIPLCVGCRVQGTQEDVLLLFAVIMSHKVFASMSLATRFLRLGCRPSRLVLVMLPYQILPPLAVIVGTFIESQNPTASLVLTCLATGTFLYVGAYEVTAEEFGTHSHRADVFEIKSLNGRKSCIASDAPELGREERSVDGKAPWYPSKPVKFLTYFIAVGVFMIITWVLPEPHDH